MIPKANSLRLPTIFVGILLLLLISFNFVAVAKETAAAADESEVRGPTFHGLINIDDNQENLQIMCKKRCSSLVNSSQSSISEEQRQRLAQKLTDAHADWLDECYFVIRCKQDYMTSSDGSGDELITDDEDQGSGNDEDVYPSSGTSVQPEITTATAAPTLRENLTPCLRQHKMHKESGNIYVPHCTKKGGYHRLQCTKHFCWCVDPNGVDIKGTNTSKSEEKPDCEHGSNMSPCIKSLLKHSSGLLGSFRPLCSESGDYKSIQCHESKCWCVNKQGIEVENTRVNLPQMPTCVETTPIPSFTVRITRPKTTMAAATTTTTQSTPTTTTTTTAPSTTTKSTTTLRATTTVMTINKDFVPKNPGNAPLYLTPLLAVMPPLISMFGGKLPTRKVKPSGKKYDINGVSVSSLNEVTNSENTNLSGSEQSQSDNATPVTREPGIMAAIIAGAVVGLFVSILLAMFVVYRMRKKDEGSYPLDEPTKNNYTYTKAPDKEFYA